MTKSKPSQRKRRKIVETLWSIASEKKQARVRAKLKEKGENFITLPQKIFAKYNLKYGDRTVAKYFKGEPVGIALFRAISDFLDEDPDELRQPEKISTAPRKSVHYYAETNRDLQMYELQSKLRQNKYTAINLFGRSGLGKTELALRLINTDKKSKRSQFEGGYCFVPVEAGNIAADIERFFNKAREQNFSQWEEAPSSKDSDAERVQWYYSNYPVSEHQILIVFDGVTEYANIERFLPSENLECFRVLITSTCTALASSCYNFRLNDFEEEDALELVRKLLDDPKVFDIHQAKIAQMCRLVGYLPLAVELVTSQLKSTEIDKDEYLRDLLEELENDDRLAEDLCEVEDGQVGYIQQSSQDKLRDRVQETGLQAVFNMTWNSFDPETKEIAYAISQFAPAPLSLSLIGKFMDKSEKKKLRKIINKQLIRKSFLDVCYGKYFQYHSLIRAFVRQQRYIPSEIEGTTKDVFGLLHNISILCNTLPTFDNYILTHHLRYMVRLVENMEEQEDAWLYKSIARKTLKPHIRSILAESNLVEYEEFTSDERNKENPTAYDEARQLSNLAYAACANGDEPKAYEYIRKALTILEDEGKRIDIDNFDDDLMTFMRNAYQKVQNKSEVWNYFFVFDYSLSIFSSLIDTYLNAADLCLILNNIKQARKYVRKTERYLKEERIRNGAERSIVHRYLLTGRILLEEEKSEEAVIILKKGATFALNIYDGKKDASELLAHEADCALYLKSIYWELVSVFLHLKKLQEIEVYIEKYFQIAEKLEIDFKINLVPEYIESGSFLYFDYDRKATALKYLQKAMHILKDYSDENAVYVAKNIRQLIACCQETKDPIVEASYLYQLAEINYLNGDFETAYFSIDKALTVLKIEEKNSHTYEEQKRVYNALLSTSLYAVEYCILLEKFEQARQYLRASEQYFRDGCIEKLQDEVVKQRWYKGWILSEEGKLEEALIFLEEAKELAMANYDSTKKVEELSDLESSCACHLVVVYAHLIKLLFALNKVREAKVYIEELSHLSQKLGMEGRIPNREEINNIFQARLHSRQDRGDED